MTCLTLLPAIAAPPAPSTVWDFALRGGPMMIPIALCSLVGLAVVFDRLAALRRRRVVPRGLLEEVERSLADHPGATTAAIAACERDGSPLARVLAATVRRLDAPRDLADRHVAEAGEREVAGLRRFLRVLATIASIAPLLGLLGTILGMIAAFRTVASSGDALGRAELLAEGIYEAMITTAAGLCIAIPALVLHQWLSSIVQSRVAEIDHAALELLDRHGVPTGIAPAEATS